MENTGRITRTIRRTAREILFGATADAAVDAELPYIARTDRAHVVMLAESGLLDRATASALLGAIDDLARRGFADLRGAIAPRGIYLLYEDHLIRAVGIGVGGALQVGRSRNDLNATIARLKMRAPFVRFAREALRLQAVLLGRARRHGDAVMPAYTHYQAAVPITYGHYLAGVATALDRDIAALFASIATIDDSPLGAGAVGGTTLPIRASRTAELLGFARGPGHSIDAVATRDFVVRALAAAAMLGLTLSRAAADLLLWTSAELGFLDLPDHLVGSSSMMPQKRNVYFLEHVQGRSAAALGAFVQAVTASHAKPFTNSIAVGTESTSGAIDVIAKTREAATLLRLVVAGASPRRDAMRASAEAGYTSATELANLLVVDGGLPFRAAHEAVGAVVRAAIEAGGKPLCAAMAEADGPVRAIDPARLDVAAVARASERGGGPGPESRSAALSALSARFAHHRRALRERTARWRSAEEALDRAVRAVTGDLRVAPLRGAPAEEPPHGAPAKRSSPSSEGDKEIP